LIPKLSHKMLMEIIWPITSNPQLPVMLYKNKYRLAYCRITTAYNIQS